MSGPTAGGRAILAACAAALALMLAAPEAHAAACGAYNPVCPWQSTQTYGDTDPASLNGPFAIAAAPDGDIVVADRAKESAREFSASGTLLTQLGTPGSYTDINGVAVDPASGEIWVAENCEVLGFGSDGTQNQTLAGCGGGYGKPQGFSPAAIAVGPNSDLYILNGFTPVVYEYSPSGSLLGSISVASAYSNVTVTGGNGVIAGSIAVDSSGDVFVEPISGPMYEFDGAGTQIASFQTSGENNGIVIAGDDLYMAQAGQIIGYPLSDPSIIGTTGRFGGPAGSLGPWTGDFADSNTGMGPAFTPTASGLDAATTGHAIEQFDAEGNETGTWGSLAVDDFSAIGAVADPAGDIFVLDGSNARIIEYDAAGDPPTVFADLPAADGLDGAAIDPAGNLVVSTGSQLLTYSSAGQIISSESTPCSCAQLIGITAAGDSYLYGWGGSFQSSGGIFEYSPGGTLLDSWPLSATYLALGPTGDIYGSYFFGSDSALHTDMAQFSPTGHLLQVIGGDQSWEPALPGPITVDPSGNLYEQASDGTIRLISPAGALLAVWPDSSGFLSFADGSLYVAGTSEVTRFSDFLNPLPPVPNSNDSPENLAMEASLLSLIAPTQTGTQTLSAPITCTGSADCAGAAELTTTSVSARRARRSAVEILGEAAFKLIPGQSTPVTIALNRTARQALANRSIRATLTLVYSAGSTHQTITASVMLHEAAAALRAQVSAQLTNAAGELADLRGDVARSPVAARRAAARLAGTTTTLRADLASLRSDRSLQDEAQTLQALAGEIRQHPGRAGGLARQFTRLSATIERRVVTDTETASGG